MLAGCGGVGSLCNTYPATNRSANAGADLGTHSNSRAAHRDPCTHRNTHFSAAG